MMYNIVTMYIQTYVYNYSTYYYYYLCNYVVNPIIPNV